MIHGALGAGTTDGRGEDFVEFHTGDAAVALVFLGILFLEMLLMAYSGSMELNISYRGFQFTPP
jgi:hypothetical protein